MSGGTADTGPGSADRSAGLHVACEIVKPPEDLRRKVSASGGPDLERIFARAERAMAAVAAEFSNRLDDDLLKLDALLEEYRGNEALGALRQLFSIVHNLRGQGTTLGFPIITQVGNSLCRYLDERDPEKPVQIEIVARHIEALRVVYRDRIEGKGDATSREVASALERIVAARI